MNSAALPLLDSILFDALHATEVAAAAHPEKSRNFRMIMAMLWSARDELDLVREPPRARAALAVEVAEQLAEQ